ncbi:MAG: choice-of-anchor Q domain-containing protein [Thermoanaerobaculales bacterium]|jgi:hypothetical protein|nr:choice-of-anchor Q domain-containing protein [Thermoanaerobaculales bacterium]
MTRETWSREKVGRFDPRRAVVIVIVVCLTCPVASAAVLEVGDHGTYSTIQDAVDAALGAGSTEIRVERGTYAQNFYVGSNFVSDDLEITGGWDSTFTSKSPDASLTVIDGDGLSVSVVAIYAGGGSVLVDGFTVTNGVGSAGGGFRLQTTGDAEVTISNNRIIGNTARSTLPSGGGVFLWHNTGTGRLLLLDNLISGNTSENTGSASAGGGGINLTALDGSSVIVTGNRIIDNTCVAPVNTSFGCGVSIYHDSSGASNFSDNLVKGNRTATAPGTDVQGAGGYLHIGPNGHSLTARRNLWIDNRDVGSQEGYHVKLITTGSGILHASDSVIAGGPEKGVEAYSYDTSTLRITNTTVFDHADTGIFFNASTVDSSLYNTIVYGSSTPTDFNGTTVDAGNNLLGVDPLFASPSTWDCRLKTGSPALDAGDNSPPGGLGTTDLDGNPRVLNGVVDIGAYEGVATLFEDGFESGNTSEWSTTVGGF